MNERPLLQRPATAWWVGIIMPIGMVIADPAIFRGSAAGDGPELGAVMPGCYCAILLGMIALAYHLRARGPSAYLAGVLLAATLFATGLGLVMLPTSILGTLFAGIGVLGLSPFLTALVFGARTRLAFRDAPAEGRLPRFLFGFLLYAGVCALAQWRIDAVWARSALGF